MHHTRKFSSFLSSIVHIEQNKADDYDHVPITQVGNKQNLSNVTTANLIAFGSKVDFSVFSRLFLNKNTLHQQRE